MFCHCKLGGRGWGGTAFTASVSWGRWGTVCTAAARWRRGWGGRGGMSRHSSPPRTLAPRSALSSGYSVCRVERSLRYGEGALVPGSHLPGKAVARWPRPGHREVHSTGPSSPASASESLWALLTQELFLFEKGPSALPTKIALFPPRPRAAKSTLPPWFPVSFIRCQPECSLSSLFWVRPRRGAGQDGEGSFLITFVSSAWPRK